MKELIFKPSLNRAEIKTELELSGFNSGLYTWYVSKAVLTKIDNSILFDIDNKHNIVVDNVCYMPLYIGIGPRNANTKKQFIKERILNCHLGSYITNSTFRMALASIMYQDQGFKKKVGNNIKYYISNEHEQLLSKFIVNNLVLKVSLTTKPWLLEKKIITEVKPILNLIHNKHGKYYHFVKERRGYFREKSSHITNLFIR